MKIKLWALLSLVQLIQVNNAFAEPDDQEKFRRIKREDIQKRRPIDIGNHLSIRHNDMRLLAPRLNGNGCADGESEVVLTDDKRTISILFNSYVVQAGQSVAKPREVKSCNILIPVSVPRGHRVAVIGLDYRGFAAVPDGGMALLKTNYQFFDQAHQPISRRVIRNEDFPGPFDEDYILTTSLKGRLNWSGCGKNMVLKIETDLSARTNQAGDDAMATLDSIDGQSSEDLTYHLIWEKCDLPGNGVGPGTGNGLGIGKKIPVPSPFSPAKYY